MAIRILTDSTCDLSKELLERYDISVLPLHVTLGDKNYRDGVDINIDMIYRHFESTKETPKTAAPSLGDLMDFFQPAVDAGDDIIFICISAQMSATYSNALLAAKEFPNTKIEVVDSANLSTGVGLLVMKAGEFVQAGMPVEEAASKIRALVPKVRASFVIDTLTYLYHGGRCTALQAFGANALGLKPKIVVANGKMGTSTKYRGKINKCLLKYTKEILDNLPAVDPSRVFVTYSSPDPALYGPIKEMVEASGKFNEVLCTTAGCVISSHCGPNTLGVLYIEE